MVSTAAALRSSCSHIIIMINQRQKALETDYRHRALRFGQGALVQKRGRSVASAKITGPSAAPWVREPDPHSDDSREQEQPVRDDNNCALPAMRSWLHSSKTV